MPASKESCEEDPVIDVLESPDEINSTVQIQDVIMTIRISF